MLRSRYASLEPRAVEAGCRFQFKLVFDIALELKRAEMHYSV